MEITIQQAITAHQEGKLKEAEQLYRSVLKTEPTNLTAMNNLGVLLRSLDRFDEAEISYKKVIELKPDFIEAHNNLGNVLKELGKLNDAEASYKKAIELKPDYVEAHYNLGVLQLNLGKLNDAEISYKKAIELKPDYAEAHSNLGVLLKEQGRLKEAEASYGQAITLKADYAEACNNLGILLEEQGRLKEAEASYGQAITLKPDYTEAHNNLGNTLKEQDRLKEAETCYRKAIVLKPDYAEACNNLGVLLKEQGRFKEAETCYRKAIALKPDFLEAYDNIGICYQAYIRSNFSGKSEKINSLEEAITLEKKKLKAKLKECPLWFVDVPRTSSKTIGLMMWNQFGFPFGGRNLKVNGKFILTTSPLLQNHTHAFIAKYIIGEEIWKEIQTFTVVRNPYDWCSSLWHHWRKIETPDVTHDTFLLFLDSLELNLQANIYNRKINSKSFLQTDYLLDEDGKILVKHVLPFEDRERITRQFRVMGINYSPGIHINKSKNSDYKMSDFERKRVEQIFAKDFEILGY